MRAMPVHGDSSRHLYSAAAFDVSVAVMRLGKKREEKEKNQQQVHNNNDGAARWRRRQRIREMEVAEDWRSTRIGWWSSRIGHINLTWDVVASNKKKRERKEKRNWSTDRNRNADCWHVEVLIPNILHNIATTYVTTRPKSQSREKKIITYRPRDVLMRMPRSVASNRLFRIVTLRMPPLISEPAANKHAWKKKNENETE